MSFKSIVLILAAVLALGVAVPALGQSSKVTPRVAHGLPVRALAKARLALLTARSAQNQARRAVAISLAAQKDAASAQSTAQKAAAATQASLDSTKVQSALASGAVSTESESYVQLPGGPSVSVDVPSSGLVEVWAQVTFAGEGAVALFEDGQRMPGQSEACGQQIASSALIATGVLTPEPHSLATPSSVTLVGGEFFCGVEGPPAGVLFQTSPGHHTYELRYQYSNCGCVPEVTFSNRLLRVAPRL